MWKRLKVFLYRKEIARASDFGRCFGWFIERNGEIIGELDYLRWDCDSQFWHDYRLIWRNSKDMTLSPDDWISMDLTLRNRRCKDVVIEDFLTSCERDGVIGIRGASVPTERLLRDTMA